ncbi:NUDIX domain-containing protein [Curtobacterium sp. C1]|uniref:NUDIX domain-containing protein n=1 Tax=Curtobacterium citreum TaxID=2036 RepID=A0A850DWG6_9MICO|nr:MULTISPECIES: NUDIX domain-containing protein [Curtobacterium]MCS6522293.1 NUDIX domain-containing protein [Curtobacterium citreum]MDK8173716.1 NUDIX domain-containing protein [Curtobacterium citreum]NUU29291.1 NUDIX domain-containing protein [Curtobacterium albidum]QKS13112.1 NUDIX domain-containing protein [Curtobacterium sp. csp3]QKS15219.1 NUDIX domain-containing protein [Curtobacterium sp. Csp2]
MPTPEYVLSLREKIGTDLLWLTGVTAVVTRGEGADRELLVVRRADTGAYTPVTGIVDPGEEPAVAAEREVLEEADVVAVAERLAWVQVLPEMTYPNGDRAQYLDLVFTCRYVSGTPAPADGENTEAFWAPLDALPAMSADMRARVAAALSGEQAARFER